MTRSPKRSKSASPAGATPLPYTDQQRQTYEFATTKRSVRSGGITERLTIFEILFRKQVESGLAGSPIAQWDSLRRAEIAVHARRLQIEVECEVWQRIKAENQQIIDQARAAKTPIPRVPPHPDDIFIDWKNGVRVVGPRSEEQWKTYDGQVRFRDALFLQQAMEDADNGVPVGDRPSKGAALVLAIYINDKLLPPSLRLSVVDVLDKTFSLLRLTRREALVRCRETWRTMGLRAARGKRFGTVETLLPMLDAVGSMVVAHSNRDDDPLGYEEAILTATDAINAHAISAPKAKARTAVTPLPEETLT